MDIYEKGLGPGGECTSTHKVPTDHLQQSMREPPARNIPITTQRATNVFFGRRAPESQLLIRLKRCGVGLTETSTCPTRISKISFEIGFRES